MPTLYTHDLAYVHHVGFRAIPEAAARWLCRYLSTHTVPDGAIVDLGSGSGIFAAGVTSTRRAVFGIEISKEMVTLAQRTAPRAHFRTGSMYEAELPECAVVTVIGEGLNYVPPGGRIPRLSATFRRVWNGLYPAGLFVFDMITGPVTRLVPNQGFQTGRDWAVLVETQASRGRDRFERHITTFREVKGRYRRSDVIHTLRVFARTRVIEALRRARFTVQLLRGYEREAQLSGRTVFVARKR